MVDEATANVDAACEATVHKTLLGLPATVVSICHRLQHVADFDRVLVLGGGTILEEGSPESLLADASSELSQMYAAAMADGST